jgi:hypothetical protein
MVRLKAIVAEKKRITLLEVSSVTFLLAPTPPRQPYRYLSLTFTSMALVLLADTR